MNDQFEFEGDEVTDFSVQLPSATLEADEAYPRGTYLTLSVQVRVRAVRLEEDRKGNLARKHILALEECQVTDVLTPAKRRELLEAAEAAAENAPAEEYTVEESPAPEPTAQPASDEPGPVEEATPAVEADDYDQAWLEQTSSVPF